MDDLLPSGPRRRRPGVARLVRPRPALPPLREPEASEDAPAVVVESPGAEPAIEDIPPEIEELRPEIEETTPEPSARWRLRWQRRLARRPPEVSALPEAGTPPLERPPEAPPARDPAPAPTPPPPLVPLAVLRQTDAPMPDPPMIDAPARRLERLARRASTARPIARSRGAVPQPAQLRPGPSPVVDPGAPVARVRLQQPMTLQATPLALARAGSPLPADPLDPDRSLSRRAFDPVPAAARPLRVRAAAPDGGSAPPRASEAPQTAEPGPPLPAAGVEPGESGPNESGPNESGPNESGPSESGLVWAVVALATAAAIIISGHIVGAAVPSRFLVPVLGLSVAAAFVPRLLARHPDEPWLGRFLLLGVGVKVIASLARYFTLVDGYGGAGDATEYHEFGVEYVSGVAAPLENLRKTNFVRWFTGNLYEWVGVDLITGFFVFGLIAFIGSYLWYRATASAVPVLNRRLYCGFVFFAPSVAFWPSSVGKEALMQFGLGLVALGIAFLLQRRLLAGLLIAAPGGWLLWVVRPHLLALSTVAGALAFAVARGPRSARDQAPTVSLVRPIGLVAVAILSVFAVSQAMQFLGMEEFSFKAIEAELAEQTGRTADGGSVIEGGDATFHLTPMSLPNGLLTVLFRPYPWEVENGFQIIASFENVALAVFMVRRRRSLRLSLTHSRNAPFLFYCWILVFAYAVAFSSFANFGLLFRQRSLMLPALFVLISLHAPKTAERPTRSGPTGRPAHAAERTR